MVTGSNPGAIGSDHKTIKLLDRSPPPDTDRAKIASSIDNSNREEEEHRSSLGPMKLEFLHDDSSLTNNKDA